MSPVDEKLTEQFYSWELRGRGWQLFDEPVVPEPPFRPFLGHYLPRTAQIDDGRRSTRLSSIVASLRSNCATEVSNAPDDFTENKEPSPEIFERTEMVELAIRLPPHFDPSREVFEQ